MLAERLYQISAWMRANPVKTGVILVAGVGGLAALLSSDVVQHALSELPDYVQRVVDADRQKFADCMAQQAERGIYNGLAESHCGRSQA